MGGLLEVVVVAMIAIMVERWVIPRLYGPYGFDIFSLIDLNMMIQLMTFNKENLLTSIYIYMHKSVDSSSL